MDTNSNINNDTMLNSARTDETSFSYSNRSNASIQILKADFISFTFFLRQKDFKTSSLNISRAYDNLNNKNTDNQLNEDNNNNKDVDNNTHKYNAKDIKNLLLDNFNKYNSHVNTGYFNKHSFMEFYRNTNLLEKVGNDFNKLFSEFEAYVIKLFSVHPTLGSTGRGIYIDDDGSMVYTLLDYIRSYESSMYLLSQKQQYYFYVSLFLLIVLLRNFRRFLHHYKSSTTLSDLMLMMAEAISMCQKHIYKYFLSKKNKFNKRNLNKCTDVLLTGQFYSDNDNKLDNNMNNNKDKDNKEQYKEGKDNNQDKYDEDLKTYLESIKIHNNNCLKIKEDIFRLCRHEFKNIQNNTDVDNNVMELDTTYASEDEFMSEDTEFTNFYDNISSMPTRREGFLYSTLDYDESEISYLSDFNLILDDKICWWISELCNLCNLYCKLGHYPKFIERRYTRLVLDSDTSVLLKLSNGRFTNLDLNRSLLIRKSIYPVNKKMKELRSEARAKGYTQSLLSKTKDLKLNVSVDQPSNRDNSENKVENKEKAKEKKSREVKDNKDTENKLKEFKQQENKEQKEEVKVDKTDKEKVEEPNLVVQEVVELDEELKKDEKDNLDNVEKKDEVNMDNVNKKEDNKQKLEEENNSASSNNENKEKNKEKIEQPTEEKKTLEVKENNKQESKEQDKVNKQNKEYTLKEQKQDKTDTDNKESKEEKQDKYTSVPKPKTKRSEYNKWTDDETNLFLEAINLHGTGHWSYISRKFFQGKRSQSQLKDKWVNLQRYKKVKQVEPPEKKVEELFRWVLVTSQGSD